MVDRPAAKTFKGGEPRLRFVVGQIRQIRVGGLPVLLRKVLTCLMMAPAAVVLFVALVVRPLVLIRFVRLEGAKMGRFAANTEMLVCQRDAVIPDRRTLDIFYHVYPYRSVRDKQPAANKQLKKMWDRTLPVYRFARLLGFVSLRLPGSQKHVAPMRLGSGLGSQ